MVVSDVSDTWAESVHDSTIFTIFDNSSLCAKFETWELKGCLVGDSGDACRHYMLTPVSNPTTAAETVYNNVHALARNCTERTSSTACGCTLITRCRWWVNQLFLPYTQTATNTACHSRWTVQCHLWRWWVTDYLPCRHRWLITCHVGTAYRCFWHAITIDKWDHVHAIMKEVVFRENMSFHEWGSCYNRGVKHYATWRDNMHSQERFHHHKFWQCDSTDPLKLLSF